MSLERISPTDPKVATALDELKALIAAKYPAASFDVFEGEDPEGVYLRATVDIEDSSDALLPALDKLHELEVEQGLPIYVVTDQPLERVIAQLKARTTEPRPTLLHLPL
jgi:hypothetical protein